MSLEELRVWLIQEVNKKSNFLLFYDSTISSSERSYREGELNSLMLTLQLLNKDLVNSVKSGNNLYPTSTSIYPTSTPNPNSHGLDDIEFLESDMDEEEII